MIKYSARDLHEAHDRLAQLAADVEHYEGLESGGREPEQTRLGRGGQALRALRDSQVTLGNPSDNLIRLTPHLFAHVGVELTEIYKRQMREQFDFYYLTLSTSLRPQRGAHFRLIECQLDLGPKGASEPIVQAIFPQSDWKEVLGWGGGLNLALDGNLEWGAGVDSANLVLVENLPGHLQASIVDKNSLKAFVTVPDYAFKLGRVEIAATGEGNSACFWRIESPQLQEVQTVQFALVFKVPQATTSLELSGLVAAEPQLAWLTAELRDVFDVLSDRWQSLLRRPQEERADRERLPIGDHETWTLELPKPARG